MPFKKINVNKFKWVFFHIQGDLKFKCYVNKYLKIMGCGKEINFLIVSDQHRLNVVKRQSELKMKLKYYIF